MSVGSIAAGPPGATYLVDEAGGGLGVAQRRGRERRRGLGQRRQRRGGLERRRPAWEDGYSAVLVKTTNPRPGLGGVARASRGAGYAVAVTAARSVPWPLCHRSTRPDLERVAREAERAPAQRLRREAIACRPTPGGYFS